MNKLSFALCATLLYINQVYSQNRSNIWELAQQVYAPDCGLDFSNGFADTFSIARNLEFFLTDASICDTNGDKLFYTNGQWIANRNDDSLLNCNQYNQGWATDTFYNAYGPGLGFVQGAIALPAPDSVNQYYLFYITAEKVVINPYGFYDSQPLHLSYSVIDMSLDNGLGGVIQSAKNKFAIIDTLVLGRLSACKHGNGRDWWIMTHEYFSKRFYKTLVSPQGVSDTLPQTIGSTTFPFWIDDDGSMVDDDIYSQAAFSPDGSHYAYVTTNESVYVFDFDRCTSELSNFRKDSLPTLDMSLYATLGCSFSPNSRYLYVNTYHRIFQYDLDAPEFVESRVLVATHDSSNAPLYGWFFMNQLAPDNKIYIGTFNSIEALHIIDQPDSPGVACNVIQHGLTLPTYNISVPNFPNYDLGALPGSPCDTLGLSTAMTSNKITASYRMYPNPVRDWVNVIYDSNTDALFELFDLYGKRVGAVSLYHYYKNRLLNVSMIPAGIYEWRVVSTKGVVENGKVVVVK